MKTNRLLKYQSLALVTGVAVFAALWAMPGTAHAQSPTPTPTDLLASLNGPICGFGCASIYQYTPQYTYTPGLAVPPSGSPPSSVVASTLYSPRGLVFDNAGNLFVASNFNNSSNIYQSTILKITPDGLMSTFASGFPDNFFLGGLVLDSAGNLFVMAQNINDPNVASTIYKINVTSSPQGMVSPFGLQPDCVQQGTNVNCSTPSLGVGLAFDNNSPQNLYAADTGATNIYKFTAAGVRTVFAGPDKFPPSPVDSTQKEGPVGLAFDSFGNLFVSAIDVSGNSTILEFPPDGTVTASFTGMPTNAGARGLAFDTFGNLFVAEVGFNGAGSGAIQEFPSVGASPTPSPAPTPITFASGYGSQSNRGPEFLAFAPPGASPLPSNPTTVALTFPNATSPLTTNVTTPTSSPTPPPPNFEITGSSLAFDITTTTTPTPPIIIAFSPVDPSLHVLHYENGNWVDSTLTWEGCDSQGQNCNWEDNTGTLHPAGQGGYPAGPASNTVYASVNSLSPFLIAKFKYAAQIQQPIKTDGSSVFSTKRGALTATFTLTSDGVATCQLPPATISVFRIAGGVVGSIAESTYHLKSDTGSNFRISNCQYVYNLSTSSLGPGTYLVNISIGGSLAGSATFTLK